MLNMVYARAVQWMNEEDREDFDNWMTCTLDEATEFIRGQAAHQAAVLADLGRP